MDSVISSFSSPSDASIADLRSFVEKWSVQQKTYNYSVIFGLENKQKAISLFLSNVFSSVTTTVSTDFLVQSFTIIRILTRENVGLEPLCNGDFVTNVFALILDKSTPPSSKLTGECLKLFLNLSLHFESFIPLLVTNNAVSVCVVFIENWLTLHASINPALVDPSSVETVDVLLRIFIRCLLSKDPRPHLSETNYSTLIALLSHFTTKYLNSSDPVHIVPCHPKFAGITLPKVSKVSLELELIEDQSSAADSSMAPTSTSSAESELMDEDSYQFWTHRCREVVVDLLLVFVELTSEAGQFAYGKYKKFTGPSSSDLDGHILDIVPQLVHLLDLDESPSGITFPSAFTPVRPISIQDVRSNVINVLTNIPEGFGRRLVKFGNTENPVENDITNLTRLIKLVDLLKDRLLNSPESSHSWTVTPVLVVLCKLASDSPQAQFMLKRILFGKESKISILGDSQRPPSASQIDVAALFPPKVLNYLKGDSDLKSQLVQKMTTVQFTLKHYLGEFFFAVCGKNPNEMVRLIGLEPSAGLLVDHNLLTPQAIASLAGSPAESINIPFEPPSSGPGLTISELFHSEGSQHMDNEENSQN